MRRPVNTGLSRAAESVVVVLETVLGTVLSVVGYNGLTVHAPRHLIGRADARVASSAALGALVIGSEAATKTSSTLA